MACRHLYASWSIGTSRAKCHLTVSWHDSGGMLSFGRCRAITWRDTSQVQPASYLGTLAQELYLSKGILPLAQVAHRRLPGHYLCMPGHCLCMPVSHIHPFLLHPCLYLNWIKSVPAQAINFANKDWLEKTLGRLGRPQSFSVDNDEFRCLKTTQAENLATSKPH